VTEDMYSAVHRTGRRGPGRPGKWHCSCQVWKSWENVAHQSTAAAWKGEQIKPWNTAAV